ncbi:lanthionine synthetase C family protein [Flagellimonas sp. S174]|uniref:lanthionine synthetase C family protein n=1 Tax=Flagellimonas sp. S174 TaxID=3410790 RepID=UPI003BF51282
MEEIVFLEEKLETISAEIQNGYRQEESLGILTGVSGMALFQFYYAKYKGDDSIADLGVDMVSYCIEKINEGFSYPTYCAGIAGLGWAIQHLSNHNFIDIECDDLLMNFDEYLFDKMRFDLSNNNIDFLHGAIGYGFYFVKRYKGTKREELRLRYEHYLSVLVKNLDKLAVKDGEEYKWESVIDSKTGAKGYNLSLSHGMSSILNFLSRLNEIGSLQDITKPILTGCLRYTLKHEGTGQNGVSLFPDSINPERPNEYSSRLAWCYGDLGIGVSLLNAGNSLDDDLLVEHSLEIGVFSTSRKLPEQTRVVDAGICHGSFGNAQIFRKFFLHSENGQFKKSIDFWIKDGIKKACYTDGHAGYKQWNGVVQEWKAELSLLEGVAGIGLAIIEHLSDEPNFWDECLMIN